MNIRPGDVGFAGKREGWYPRAVRYFTQSRWSHCFVVTQPVFNVLSVIEADVMVVLRPFEQEYVEKNNDYYEIWRPTKATPAQVEKATNEVYKNQSGVIYGFLQIPWFAIRAMAQKVGIELKSNPFPSGIICSETQWAYFMALGGEYAGLFNQLTQNEVSPEDLYKLVKNNPQLFEFIGKRL
jgi:hypothetical protein